MNQLNIEIVTPSKIVYSGAVNSCSVPGSSGSFQVLDKHADILSTFEIGIIKINDTKSGETIYATGGGTIEVKDNQILLLAESVEVPDEIDPDRAKASMERAKERIYGGHKEDIDYVRAEASLKRAINRISVSKKTG